VSPACRSRRRLRRNRNWLLRERPCRLAENVFTQSIDYHFAIALVLLTMAGPRHNGKRHDQTKLSCHTYPHDKYIQNLQIAMKKLRPIEDQP
jgi:hypothetical protein